MSSCFSCFSFSFFAPRKKTQNIKRQLQQALSMRHKEFLCLGRLLIPLFEKHDLGELNNMLSRENDLRWEFSQMLPTTGTPAYTFFNKVKALTQNLEVLKRFSEQKKVFIEEVAVLEEKEVKALHAMNLLADIPLTGEAAVDAAKWQQDYQALCARLCADFNAFKEGIREQIASTKLFPKGVGNIIADYYYSSVSRLTLGNSTEE